MSTSLKAVLITYVFARNLEKVQRKTKEIKIDLITKKQKAKKKTTKTRKQRNTRFCEQNLTNSYKFVQEKSKI